MARYLVTGVSRGIGKAVAERLVADGHEVFGVARTSASVPADLALAGIVELELTDFDAYADALAAPLLPASSGEPEDAGWLDGLVHCAGVVRPGPLAASRAADFADQFAVNVTAVAELTRHCLPALRGARGSVVLINSGSGLNARPPLSSYGASKFALRGYADALRQEEPELRVCTVYPGRTDTDMQQLVRDAEAGAYQATAYLTTATVAGVVASVLALPRDATITDLTLRPANASARPANASARPANASAPSSPDAHR